MSWKHLSLTDGLRIMQAVADVAPDKASKLGAVMAKGAGVRARMKREAAAEDFPPFVNPGPTPDESAVLEEILGAIRAKLTERWGAEYTVDLEKRIRS